ncbi:MAG: sulfatase-like hydrolase/transferase [Planctomycetota bacterium]
MNRAADGSIRSGDPVPSRRSTRSAASARRSRLAATYWAWILSIVLASIIGQGWLHHASAGASLAASLFMQGALVSTMTMLSVVIFLPLLLAAWLVESSRALAIANGLLWALFLVLLYADTVIYGMFRYHFNGLVWHELTTPGSEESIHLDATLWTEVALGTLAAGICVWGLWTTVARRGAREPATRRRWFARPGAIAALLLVATILGEKAAYAYADFTRDRSVMARGRLFPLYQPLTIKNLLGKHLGYDLTKRERVDFAPEGVLIQYPLERPRIPPVQAGRARPNILIVVIDSLRHDMLVPAVMPNVSRWADGGRRFQEHLSGGNATRFGIFSLVYGMHGSYWAPILNEQAPPVLVTSLVDAGYEPRVIAAATMNSPEFRSTCWVSIEDSVHDQLPGEEKYERDRNVGADFETWIAQRDASRPFFAFALLDSPHQTYSVDPALTPFVPYATRVDYLALAGEPTPEFTQRIWNRYKNACATADVVVGGMVSALERQGIAENTIVVVTGDHGEEFYEHGHFGHTSNFTREQTWVGFVMRGPGIAPGEELRPTSHIDLAPTLLELLGVDASLRGKYSLGGNLLAPEASRLRVIAGWQELGLWLEGGILRIPMEGHKGLVEAYDYNWKPLPEEAALQGSEKTVLRNLGEECRRFLR